MERLCQLLQKKFPSLPKIKIQNVVMDSRKITEGSLFFAIQNGNQYVQEALDKGASLVIADRYSGNHEKVIKVENTILVMQELAEEYRRCLKTK